MNSLIIENTFN